MTPGRAALAVAGIAVVLFAGSFALGRASGGEDEPTAPSGAQQIAAPDAATDVPRLASVGAVPPLRPAPDSGGGSSTTGSIGATTGTIAPTTTTSANVRPLTRKLAC